MLMNMIINIMQTYQKSKVTHNPFKKLYYKLKRKLYIHKITDYIYDANLHDLLLEFSTVFAGRKELFDAVHSLSKLDLAINLHIFKNEYLREENFIGYKLILEVNDVICTARFSSDKVSGIESTHEDKNTAYYSNIGYNTNYNDNSYTEFFNSNIRYVFDIIIKSFISNI